MSYEKPIPLKNEDNAPFWDAADRHELFCKNVIHANSSPIHLDRHVQSVAAVI